MYRKDRRMSYGESPQDWCSEGYVGFLEGDMEPDICDEPFAYLELQDTIYPQYFSLPVDVIKAADGVDIHFRFVIEDVYPGTRYEDTCLTGLVVEFMGRHGH